MFIFQPLLHAVTMPAVVRGLTAKPWTVRELIDRTMDFRPPTQFERFIDTLPDEG